MSLEKQTRGAELARAGRFEDAWGIICPILLDNPMDLHALVTGSYVMLKLGGLAQAYHFARAATQIAPEDDAAWTNLGHAASQMWLIDEAEHCYRRALDCARSEEHRKVLWLNLGALFLDNGRFADAEAVTRKILEVDPTHHNAIANIGFCQLANRNFAEGWKNYHNTIGSDWRPKVQYKDEPEWDGSPDKRIVIYSDQGLGDEICSSSMLPDAEALCKRMVLDCDERLAGLFRRSFPQVKVYGSRRAKPGSVKWDKEDREIDASLPLGQLGEFVRTRLEDFPGTPYLEACPTRLAQWRAVFAAKGKPCVGIAWTGGIHKTNARNRKLTLEALLPVLSLDCHFVSLQYKDASQEIASFKDEHRDIDIAQYPWATLTSDYDDTAALVAALDYVVCIQTAVAHTAGALGTAVTVLVPEATQWRYGEKFESVPWYSCMKVVRQQRHGFWESEIERARENLASHIGKLQEGAGGASRDGELWSARRELRRARVADFEAHRRSAPSGLRQRFTLLPGKSFEGTS